MLSRRVAGCPQAESRAVFGLGSSSASTCCTDLLQGETDCTACVQRHRSATRTPGGRPGCSRGRSHDGWPPHPDAYARLTWGTKNELEEQRDRDAGQSPHHQNRDRCSDLEPIAFGRGRRSELRQPHHVDAGQSRRPAGAELGEHRPRLRRPAVQQQQELRGADRLEGGRRGVQGHLDVERRRRGVARRDRRPRAAGLRRDRRRRHRARQRNAQLSDDDGRAAPRAAAGAEADRVAVPALRRHGGRVPAPAVRRRVRAQSGSGTLSSGSARAGATVDGSAEPTTCSWRTGTSRPRRGTIREHRTAGSTWLATTENRTVVATTPTSI